MPSTPGAIFPRPVACKSVPFLPCKMKKMLAMKAGIERGVHVVSDLDRTAPAFRLAGNRCEVGFVLLATFAGQGLELAELLPGEVLASYGDVAFTRILVRIQVVRIDRQRLLIPKKSPHRSCRAFASRRRFRSGRSRFSCF